MQIMGYRQMHTHTHAMFTDHALFVAMLDDLEKLCTAASGASTVMYIPRHICRHAHD